MGWLGSAGVTPGAGMCGAPPPGMWGPGDARAGGQHAFGLFQTVVTCTTVLEGPRAERAAAAALVSPARGLPCAGAHLALARLGQAAAVGETSLRVFSVTLGRARHSGEAAGSAGHPAQCWLSDAPARVASPEPAGPTGSPSRHAADAQHGHEGQARELGHCAGRRCWSAGLRAAGDSRRALEGKRQLQSKAIAAGDGPLMRCNASVAGF